MLRGALYWEGVLNAVNLKEVDMEKAVLYTLKKTRRFVAFLFLLFLFPAFVTASEDNAFQENGAALEVRVLDVGQGLSVVLSCGNHFLLYDGGPGSASSKVVSYLQQHVTYDLDYVIASHYDEDHLGGVIGAMHAFSVDTLIAPDYQTDTTIYTSFIRAAQERGIPVTYASAGQTYQLGDASFQILMPLMPTYPDENDYSVVIRAWYGDTSIIITGDCTSVGEHDMLLAQELVDSDILVAGHHGSGTSTCADFLDAASPFAAVISCGTDNAYGHPSQAVMEQLQMRGIPVWRTDMQGDISFYGDGTDWYYDPAPVNDYSYREQEADYDAPETGDVVRETAPEATAVVEDTYETYEPAGAEYVLNTNTYKFHYPDCASVYQMKDKNREYVTASREEIMSWGYSPCGNCHP